MDAVSPPRFRSALGPRLLAGAAVALAALAALAHDEDAFRVRSATFQDGATLPASLADNYPPSGPNICTADGSIGGNTSPELSWDHAPERTRSFAVVMYDVTASFTHWSIYNIPGGARGLPVNAGSAASGYGAQVNNDFGSLGYEGPCPPAGVAPDAHHYVFTVYALDRTLELPVFANFPQNAETLEHALAEAAIHGHVLAQASIGGYFSATPTP